MYTIANRVALSLSVVLCVLLCVSVGPCAVTKEGLTPEKARELIALERAEALAKASRDAATVARCKAVLALALEKGIESVDALELDAARAIVEASEDPLAIETAEANLARFEEEVINERAGPIYGAVAATVPWAAPWLPLAQLLITPFLGKRSRPMAIKGVRTSWKLLKADPTALVDFAKALGWAHTSDATKAVAKGAAVAVPTQFANAAGIPSMPAEA